MDRLETLLAERDCERLTYRYCRFADCGEASRLAELFTEDGVFSTPDMTLRGRLEIARTFAKREVLTDLQTLHLCTNIEVEVLDELFARGCVNLCLFRRWRDAGTTAPVPVTTPSLVAAYEDTYERVDGRWLLATRNQRVVFADPADTGWTR
jgi:SnoaL-like protein